MSTEAKCQIDWRQDFYANARNILVMIDPQVPVYISPGVESWDSVRPLSEDLSEFSWDGTLKLPEVRRLLRGATRVAAQLAAKDEQLAELRDIAERLVAECDDTYYDPIEAMSPEWQRLYADAKAALSPAPPQAEQA
jgi:DNA-binding FadR family transcriptional regulator